MKVELGYGKTTQIIDVPDQCFRGELHANHVDVALTGSEEVRRALLDPIGSAPLGDIVHPGEKIAVITSDITRPCPSFEILPPLLEELEADGISLEDITVVFALGSHRPHTEAEQRRLVGDAVFEKVRCIDGDVEDTVHLGVTKRGTPVDIVRPVAEADRRICLGNIEYHYFAGYSGGAKAIMPGSSTPKAIQMNHRFMVDAASYQSHLEGNPVREDIEEAAAMVGVDFILNVVLDEEKRIIKAVAGDVTAAHRVGCAFLDTLYKVEIEEKADIVVVSQGGAPKDLNLYQLQKALDNAKHAVKDGGIIILVGACEEGLGNANFERWMTGHKRPEDMIEHIQRDFQLGGHKAAAIAKVMGMADIYLVSELAPSFAASMFFKPYHSAQEALADALDEKGADASVLVMGHGGSVLPFAKRR
jgi:nickel-dependent lactate racemase